MKKKLLATILTGLLLALTACGSQESPVIPEVTGTAIENTQEAYWRMQKRRLHRSRRCRPRLRQPAKWRLPQRILKAAVIRKMRNENTPIPTGAEDHDRR